MIHIEDYFPIDPEAVYKERELIVNVPHHNKDWENIQHRIDIINDINAPLTLRTYHLNHLPYIVIELLNHTNI